MLSKASPGVLTFARVLLAPLCFSCSLTQAAEKNYQYLLFEPSVLNEQHDVANNVAPPIAGQEPAFAELAPGPSTVGDQQDFSETHGLAEQHGTVAHAVQDANAALTIEEVIAAQGNAPADQLGAIERDIAEYKKVIAELEQQGGAYEAKLSEELLSLASLYQKTGEYAEAQKILNRAAHIARINNGLFDESQIPVIKRVIQNYVELGDILAADRQQAALFYMQKKIHGDSAPGLLPGLQYFADWNLFAATTNITPPPASEDTEADGKPVVDLVTFQFERLITAQSIYEGMRQMLLRNPGYSEIDIAEVEEQQLIILHLFATRYGPYVPTLDGNIAAFSTFSNDEWPSRGFNNGYRTGIDILESRIDRLQRQSPVDIQQIADAKIQLSDWLLLFERRTTALTLLEETYQELQAVSASEDELNEFLAPPLPRHIPRFLHHRYTRAWLGLPDEVPLQYKGYVDLWNSVCDKRTRRQSGHRRGDYESTRKPYPARTISATCGSRQSEN